MASKFVAYSGFLPADFTLPDAQVGGDNAASGKREAMSAITVTRGGLAISVRPWKTIRKWVFNYNSIGYASVDSFKRFFEAGVFKFQPFGSSTIEFSVRWVDATFEPVEIMPNYYSLSFAIEEVID